MGSSRPWLGYNPRLACERVSYHLRMRKTTIAPFRSVRWVFCFNLNARTKGICVIQHLTYCLDRWACGSFLHASRLSAFSQRGLDAWMDNDFPMILPALPAVVVSCLLEGNLPSSSDLQGPTGFQALSRIFGFVNVIGLELMILRQAQISLDDSQ